MNKKSGLWGSLCSGLLLFASSAYADISGKVYQDFNANGQQDTGTSLNEPGAAGVTIKAYGTDGSEAATATSAADGTYTLSGLTAGEHYRIEFTWTDAWLKPGTAGGTSVQFAQDGATGINAAINNPANYCQANPLIVSPVMRNGDPNAGGTTGNAFAWKWMTYDNTKAGIVTTAKEVGALWGEAYQRSTKTLFGSAMLRRHSGLGKINGVVSTGAIYAVAVDGTSFQVSPWLDVNTLAGVDTGQDTRAEEGSVLPASLTSPNHDPLAFTQVGKRGIGDIDVSMDDKKLYLINVFQRTFLTIDIETKSLVSSIPIPNPGCSDDNDYRPWAIGVNKFEGGKV